jgi:hypothetical protein
LKRIYSCSIPNSDSYELCGTATSWGASVGFAWSVDTGAYFGQRQDAVTAADRFGAREDRFEDAVEGVVLSLVGGETVRTQVGSSATFLRIRFGAWCSHRAGCRYTPRCLAGAVTRTYRYAAVFSKETPAKTHLTRQQNGCTILSIQLRSTALTRILFHFAGSDTDYVGAQGQSLGNSVSRSIVVGNGTAAPPLAARTKWPSRFGHEWPVCVGSGWT